MAELANSLSKYERVVSYGAAGVQAGALLAIVVGTALGLITDHQLIISFVIAPLYIVGLGYALLGLKPMTQRKPDLALLLLVAPLAISTLIMAYLEDGIESGYYLFWLVLIMTSGISGIMAVDTTISVGIAYYLLLAGVSFASGKNYVGDWPELVATLLAMSVAYVIAQQAEQVTRNREKAENLSGQLVGEQSKIELMIEEIADAVIGVNQSCQIVVFNRAAEELTGWDRASAMGLHYNNVLGLHDPKDRAIQDSSDPFLKAFEASGKIKLDDYYILGKNDEKIIFSIAVAPTKDASGNLSGAIAIFHDISEQKALQRERNEFVSTASHEMRTPVAAIEGYLSMASNPRLAQIDVRGKDYIEKAHQAALHLGKLFRDLLSVTKLEDRTLNDHPEVFSLAELTKQTVETINMLPREKDVVLSFRAESKLMGSKTVLPLANVLADKDRVQEALNNLIDNAIKYTPRGKVEVTLEEADSHAIVRVADTGMGISPEDQKHLFEKFYRVNNSKTREIGGTGLGLYISRNLIEHYGGKVNVKSSLGKGSIFSFSLPLASERQANYNNVKERVKNNG